MAKRLSKALKFELAESSSDRSPSEAVLDRIDRIISDPNFDLKELKDAADVLKRLADGPDFALSATHKPFAPALFEHQSAFTNCGTRFTAFIGGVRSGKTYAGAAKGLSRALLLPTVGAAVAPTAGMARDVLVPQYAALAGGHVAKWNGSIAEMTLDNGSKILFRSADNPDRLMGLTLDWFHLDEAAQLPRRVWEVLVNRTISTGGPGFLTTTPRGRNWVWQLLKSWENDRDAEAFFAKTSDNPLIDPKEIERARHQLDARYFRQQFEASFEEEGLRVYGDFSPMLHILEEPWHIRDKWPIYIGIDFGWTHPSAIIWAQLSPEGKWVVFDELVQPHLRLEKIAAAIMGETIGIVGRNFRAKVPYSRVERVISGAEGLQSRQEGGGESALSALAGMGVTRTVVSRSRILAGVNAVRAKLMSADGEINLLVDPRCRRIADDFLGYVYPSNSDGKPSSELPEKDGVHDHSMDALRYMIDFVTPIKGEKWRFG